MDNLCEKKVDSMNENFDFLRRVNPALLTLYPLQLANVERLEKNDTVFIFDEVGCGKTISSGLMALSFLEKYKDKKVLVITINSLVKTGQFRNDWFNRLPFTEEQKNRITVINDHVRRIQEAGKENWGLIIVDEAQLFLSDGITGKWEALKSLNGEKVVFLTATPIRKSENDLEEYIRIASGILKKEYVKAAGNEYPKELWEEKIREFLSVSIVGKEATEENVCARFEPSYPVTRYFKDTVRFLEKVGDNDGAAASFEPKNKSKRRFAMIWSVEDNSVGRTMTKEECLFAHIQNVLKEDNRHHFVVFAMKQQAMELGEYFGERGFTDYYKKTNNDDKTYRVITGDNSEEFGAFKGRNSAGNPTVLFVNYQVAEQGLNLPGFDYVVNFQISRFPSRLEQRFGRIDRLDKSGNGLYDTINVCYVLDSWFDSSTRNFYKAAEAYLESVIPFLPSRNMILTRDILSYLEDDSEVTKKLLSEIWDKLKNGTVLSEKEKDIVEKMKKTDEEDEDSAEDGIEATTVLTELEIVENWLNELEKFQSKQKAFAKFAIETGIIRETGFSDEIFIRYADKKIKTVTNAECAQAILQGEEYKRYCSLIGSLAEVYKVKELHERTVTHAMNSYLCMAFALGDLGSLYPLDGFKRQMKRILHVQTDEYMEMLNRIMKYSDIPEKDNNSRRIRYHYLRRTMRYSMRKWEETGIKLGWDSVLELSEEDKEFLIENAESFLLRLPIYQYLQEAGERLFIYNGSMCNNGNLEQRLWSEEGKYYPYWLECFCETYNTPKFWRYYIEGEDGGEPSPFLKLFYHYERSESTRFFSVYGMENNPYELFYCREKECKGLLEDFLDYAEMSASENKEERRKCLEERLQLVEHLNEAVKDWYGDRENGRCTTSWYGQIFNESRLKRKQNWRIKKVKDYRVRNECYIPADFYLYANNNNKLIFLLCDLLCKDVFKKPDYWSYNLIREMLQVEDYFRLNPVLKKIYSAENPDYELNAIGITRENLQGIESELVNRVLVAISPWLRGN